MPAFLKQERFPSIRTTTDGKNLSHCQLFEALRKTRFAFLMRLLPVIRGLSPGGSSVGTQALEFLRFHCSSQDGALGFMYAPNLDRVTLA